MRVKSDDVLKIAELAHLAIDANDVEIYTKRFNEILDYIDQQGEVDTSQVEAKPAFDKPLTPLREDEIGDSLTVDQALQNAPERFESFFLVPKVVDS